jgi:hypothetical protein
MAKKPKKPKTKTIRSLEAYLVRYANWKKGLTKKESDKKKLENLKKRVAAL